MNRRELLASAGAAAFVLSSGGASADEHMDHDHGAMMEHGAMSMPLPNAKLIDTASNCVKAGQACIAHCLASFTAGDTSLAACATNADQMLSVCATLQKLASAGSAHLPEIARLALAVCQDCEKECRKHEMHHATCKACADACAACAEECKKAT